jgi:hypothetical protein
MFHMRRKTCNLQGLKSKKSSDHQIPNLAAENRKPQNESEPKQRPSRLHSKPEKRANPASSSPLSGRRLSISTHVNVAALGEDAAFLLSAIRHFYLLLNRARCRLPARVLLLPLPEGSAGAAALGPRHALPAARAVLSLRPRVPPRPRRRLRPPHPPLPTARRRGRPPRRALLHLAARHPQHV